jgi:hypothetical protein
MEKGEMIARSGYRAWIGGLALLVCAVVSPGASAQKAAASHASKAVAAPAFEPLERWKQAVLAGDRAGLAGLYAAMPGAFAQTPRGRFSDPGEEPQYWAGLRAAGLQSINPKILQMDTRQPGTAVLTLRIDVTLRSGGQTQEYIVSGAQMWVQQAGGWQIYRSQRTDLLPRPAIRLPEPARPNPQLYPEPEAAHRDLDAALTAARADHKRVLVVFGANWCYDCHVLDAAFHSKEISPLITANYHLVHVNVNDGTSNVDLARMCQVQPDKLPSLAVLDENGRLVTSQRNGEFDSAVRIGMGDVRQFLEQWKPAGVH